MTLHKRVMAAGYGELWDTYGLRFAGILHMVVPKQLSRPSVITPESAEPLPGPFSHVRLTPAEHRELLHVLFGEDPGVSVGL